MGGSQEEVERSLYTDINMEREDRLTPARHSAGKNNHRGGKSDGIWGMMTSNRPQPNKANAQRGAEGWS